MLISVLGNFLWLLTLEEALVEIGVREVVVVAHILLYGLALVVDNRLGVIEPLLLLSVHFIDILL